MKNLKKYLACAGILVGISYFYSTVYAETQKNEQPMVTVGNGTISCSFYGYMKMDIIHDIDDNKLSGIFSPSAIPVEADGTGQKTIFNNYDTRVGMNVAIPMSDDAEKGTIKLNLHTGFTKPKETPGKTLLKLREVYADWWKFRVGYDYSVFTDHGSTVPNVISDAGVPSNVGTQVGQVRFMDKLNENFHYAVALEEMIMPGKAANDELTPKKSIPTAAAHFVYKGNIGVVQLAGIVRTLEYYNTAEEEDKQLIGFGGELSTALNIIPEKTVLKLQGMYSEGVGSYVRDAAIGFSEPVDIIRDNPLTKLTLFGGYGALEHYWVPKVRSVVCGSYLQAGDDDKRVDDAFKNGIYAAANLAWLPTKQVMWGIEYLWGQKTNIDNKQGQAKRIQTTVKFKF